MLVPVLLSGGVGSRLWPVSRAGRTKQFLPLGGEGSMLQETLRRLQGLECGAPIVVCNAEHRFMVAEQLRGESAVPPEIILEPAGRNTAPAIARREAMSSCRSEISGIKVRLSRSWEIADEIASNSPAAVDSAAAKPPAATSAITKLGSLAISGLASTRMSLSSVTNSLV